MAENAAFSPSCNAPRRLYTGAGRFPHTGPPGISNSVGAYRLTKHRKRGRAAWNRRRQRSGRLSLRRKRAGCASMSFGCRSLSVPNSAPRRLPDATDPHRQREGNGYAEQGRGRCAARRHLLPPVGGGRGQGRPRAGQPQHPEPEVHAGTVRGRARLADIQYLQRRRLYGQRQGTRWRENAAARCAAESCKANTAVRENTCGAAPTLWPRSAARV